MPVGSSSSTALVVAHCNPSALQHRIPDHDFVIAADSGLDAALVMGLSVQTVIGDFDSVSPDSLEIATATGVAVQQYPAAKDATDLELAMDAAISGGATRLIILGSAGGRLDHALALFTALSRPDITDVEVCALMDDAMVTIVRRQATLRGTPGDFVSLLPLHADALGVQTRGLLYPLHEETLFLGMSRGVSNEFVANEASVSLTNGTLAAVQSGSALGATPA